MSTDEVTFKRNDVVGHPDADADEEFLENCFVTTGDLEVLKDYRDPRCIILGRTGSGKTALINRLLWENSKCFEISPETLSLNHIANSNVIDFFEGVGVNLDVFYKLLWQHVITTELLKHRFHITNEQTKTDFLQFIRNIVIRDKSKERALNYLEKWESNFWEETETKVRNLTRQIEQEFLASAGVEASIISAGAKGVIALNEEEKSEIIQRGRQVVNGVQIKDLISVIKLLADDIFNDNQRQYMIVIDRLDEKWAEDAIRFKLIKALIESIKVFRKVQNVKIVLALRVDLKDRVMSETISPGFQEEKYKSLYLPLKWSQGEIKNLLENRVSYFFQHKYTKENVHLKDILPRQPIDGGDSADYIVRRTFLRPREAIMFLNTAIEKATDEPRINANSLRTAEIAYSQERLQSLADEWRDDYPLLPHYYAGLRDKGFPLFLSAMSAEDINLWICDLAGRESTPSDSMCELSNKYMHKNAPSYEQFLSEMISILYKIGVVGLRLKENLDWQWSYLHEASIPPDMITREAEIDIHLTFRSALGTERVKKGKRS